MAFHSYDTDFLPKCPDPSTFLNSLKEQITLALDSHSVGSFYPPTVENPPETDAEREAALRRKRAGDGSLRAVDLAPMIDHTLLKPEATAAELAQVCNEAKTHGFKGVCVNSSRIGLVASLLDGSSILPIAVVGFPSGVGSSEAKAFEANRAVADGAREIDMVIHRGALKEGDYARVFQDIWQVVQAVDGIPVKVILESAVLTLEEKIVACVIAREAGAAFVKTSTGFGGGGATVEDVALMRRIVGTQIGVKASGGIRSRADALKMIQAGATRLGTSASVVIVGYDTRSASPGGGY